MTSVGTSTSHGLGQGLVPSKFANMEEWFLTSYEGLMDQTSAESLTAHLEHLQELSSPEHQAVPSLDYSLQKLMQIKSSLQPAAALSENEIKSAIIGHPQYRELVTAHMNCHKVGAPAELVAEMDELIQKHQEFDPAVKTSIGVNPELDQFMVAYVNVLNAYENEMKKTFKEAIEFCKKLEQQLSLISNGSIDALASAESDEKNDGYDEEVESGIGADVDLDVDPLAGDKELKQMLMRKYGAFIKGLTQEYLKKKKKGKLPKESRQKLLDWWSQHQDHPYPSEVQKASLAQSTGLDPKQINNWFINQRKRHWNPGAAATSRGESSQQGNSS